MCRSRLSLAGRALRGCRRDFPEPITDVWKRLHINVKLPCTVRIHTQASDRQENGSRCTQRGTESGAPDARAHRRRLPFMRRKTVVGERPDQARDLAVGRWR